MLRVLDDPGGGIDERSTLLALHAMAQWTGNTYTLHPTPYTLHPTPYTLHPGLATPLHLNLVREQVYCFQNPQGFPLNLSAQRVENAN